MQLHIPPLTYDDALCGYRLLAQGEKRRQTYLFVELVAAMLVLTTVVLIIVPAGQDRLIILVMVASGVASCAFYLIWLIVRWWYVFPRNVRRMHAGAPPADLLIDDSGLTENAPASYSRHTWDAFRRSIEDKHVFLLFVADHLALLVPKRCLTPSQIEDLRAFLRAQSLLN
jgi:hypothetical protein